MNCLDFALTLESAICNELSQVKEPLPSALIPIIEKLIVVHNQIIKVLTDKQSASNAENANSQILLSLDSITINEQLWRDMTKGLSEQKNVDWETIIKLWTVYTLLDRSHQYYKQASLNSSYPTQKLFFSSIAEIKSQLKRRIDSLIRIYHNQKWADIGFAPFDLGKS